jgi:hypothetical protein
MRSLILYVSKVAINMGSLTVSRIPNLAEVALLADLGTRWHVGKNLPVTWVTLRSRGWMGRTWYKV